MSTTTDRNDPGLDETRPDGQQEKYLVLSAAERAKGFVRPVRTSYRHVGARPTYEVRELTAEEHERYDRYHYMYYEEYPPGQRISGRFWTDAEVRRGCGAVTTMGTDLAETYARDPKFYGSTFCSCCGEHYDVADAGERLAELADRLRGCARAVGVAVTRLLQSHFRQLPPNRNGWPSTGFWAGAARGTGWDLDGDAVIVYADNEEHPGAVDHLYRGGTIRAKDKKLTIPARAEFYGHSAGEFDNLRLVVFKGTGTAALVVGKGGTGRVDFSTGRSRAVLGAGARSEGVVAYWLKDEVTTRAYQGVIPTEQQIATTAVLAMAEVVTTGGLAT
jgi:hypothetical protein